MNLRDKIWDILILIFILILVTWGIKRAKYDLRWSAWALGDAQNLNAAIHFSEEGFKEHHFLPYYHAGFLGKSFGSESLTGYYTRYPPFSPVFLGIQMKWFGNNRTTLKITTVIVSGLAILFSYLMFSLLFKKRIAFFSSIFIGSSIGFLQFTDCLCSYMYSEFFRFTILFFFLLSEKKKDQPLKSSLALILTWVFLFFESSNSLDYFLFFPLFFILYYIFYYPKGQLPLKKLFFLLSAPLLGYGLHFLNVTLALQQYGESGSSTFLKGFLEKTAPFHNGPFSVFKFIFYFLKTINSRMIHDNFGFGFGQVFFMTVLIYLLNKFADTRNSLRESYSKFSTTQILLIFGVPSISWWVVFSNHAASFFYTPMHIFPFVGLLFGICIHYLIELAQKNTKTIRMMALGVLLGLIIRPLFKTTQYLLRYPNLLDPSKNVTLGELQGFSREKIEDMILLSQSLNNLTNKGDIIIVPESISSHFFEYYSQRRMDGYGSESMEDLKRKIEEINRYKETGAKKFRIFNPNLKLFCLLKNDSPLLEFVSTRYKVISPLAENWTLFKII